MGENGDSHEDVFQIGNKERDPEALLRWRQATLVLNATRRFRYTAKVENQAKDGAGSPHVLLAHDVGANGLTPAQRFRKSGHALMAVQRFKEAGKARKSRFADMGDGFGLTSEQLVQLNEEASVDKLLEWGGVSEICRALRVSPQKGISAAEEELQKRRDEFGTNTYPPAPSKSWLLFAWEAAQDKTLIILMICAVISLVAGMLTSVSDGWYDGVAIAVAVIIVILVTATSDYMQSLQFQGLNAEKANIQLKVLRDGRVQTVSIFQLLVGDIVPLGIGDQVPADGLIISAHSLIVDESSMTGESEPIQKGMEVPFMLSGCKVLDGVGSMLVTAVGINTEWGKVAATLNQEDESETPLQVRLNGLATGIGKLGVTVAALVLVVLLIRFGVSYASEWAGQPASAVVKEVTNLVTIAITIIVVAVPEGLPLAVTLTLAFSMHKMMQDKALVRRLSACETMGCATCICSDKTGTLTLNQMTAVKEFVAGELHTSEGAPARGGLLWECLSEGIAQNGTGSVFLKEDGSPEVTASPTEAAVISWALKLGLDFNATKAASTIVGMVTFNSSKKRGGVTVQLPSGLARVHWKGAAEIIVDLCSTWMAQDGQEHPLDSTMRESIDGAITEMAGQSLRCVGLAFRRLRDAEAPAGGAKGDKEWAVPEDELCLLAVIGIKDPCRPGVPDAVAACQGAGVKVRMVTGDNALTARAIAQECGILSPHGRVIEGKEFRALSKDEIIAILPSIDVMARSSPSDKHLMVATLRQLGEVVAVTGDGTNDAPALKEADIGLSMGISGTEVAKESSDIVILDDNFTSIVKVVRWGRSVFANLQKFIQFQLTVNVGALIINFIVACSSGSHVPLTAVQLLWVNLIMDTLAALALATEPPTADLLQQKPNGRTAPLITNVMWRNIVLMSLYQVVILLVLYYDGYNLLRIDPAAEDAELLRNTVIFNTFVMCQLFNEFNARKPYQFNVFEGLFKNPLFIAIIIVSAGMQVAMVEVVALHNFANTTSLPWQYWVLSIIVGIISLPLAVVFKLIPVPETPFGTLLNPRSYFGKKTPLAAAGDAGSDDGAPPAGAGQGAEGGPLLDPAQEKVKHRTPHQNGADGVNKAS